MSFSSKTPWQAIFTTPVTALLLAGCAALLLSGCGGDAPEEEAVADPAMQGPPPAAVRVGVVEIKALQHRVPVIGRLKEVRRVTVTAEVEGKITDLTVDEGDRVSGGESTVAQIDKVWAELRLKSAIANAHAAESELKQAQSDLEQLEKLQRAGSAKSREVDDAQTLVATNTARLEAAVAAREQASTEILRTTITAPFDGAVSQTLVEVGQWVDPGEGVAEIISTGEIDAVIDVPERYINALNVGADVEVIVDALDESVLGQIVSVRPDGTDASRTFPVKVRLPDMDGKLRAGMSVTANVPITREGDFITVPRDSVLFSPGGASVWYAMDMGGPMPAALPEPVNVLFGVGERYAVEPLPGGPFPALNPGTQVVIEGAERLFPTQPLSIMNPPAGAGQPSADSPPAGPPNPEQPQANDHNEAGA